MIVSAVSTGVSVVADVVYVIKVSVSVVVSVVSVEVSVVIFFLSVSSYL